MILYFTVGGSEASGVSIVPEVPRGVEVLSSGPEPPPCSVAFQLQVEMCS